MASLWKAPCYCLPYYVQAKLTSKNVLLLVIVLSALKRYTEDYWLFRSQYCVGEWSILFLLQLLLNKTMKGTFSAIIYLGLGLGLGLGLWINYIFNCDDNHTSNVYVSYMSMIVIFLTISGSVICCHFCHIFQISQRFT